MIKYLNIHNVCQKVRSDKASDNSFKDHKRIQQTFCNQIEENNDTLINFQYDYFTSKDNRKIRWGYMCSQKFNNRSDKMKKKSDSSHPYPTYSESSHEDSVGSDSSHEDSVSSDSPHEESVKGLILLLNGRTEFMEKYRTVASKLCNLGFIVISLDWRGQGLSARELPNRDKGYIKDFQLYIDDLNLFYNSYVAHYSIDYNLPITIIAHSMGGHIALRFLAQAYKNLTSMNLMNLQKAILISPMIDIVTSSIDNSFVNIVADCISRRLAKLAVKGGFEYAYIPGGKDYCFEKVMFEDNPLTHDWDNFWLEHREIEKNRELALGGVTWGWLKAAFDSIAVLKDEKYLSHIKIPVHVFSAEEDRVVSNNAQKQICQVLHKGQFISIPKARHEILFETDNIRELLWKHILLEI